MFQNLLILGVLVIFTHISLVLSLSHTQVTAVSINTSTKTGVISPSVFPPLSSISLVFFLSLPHSSPPITHPNRSLLAYSILSPYLSSNRCVCFSSQIHCKLLSSFISCVPVKKDFFKVLLKI